MSLDKIAGWAKATDACRGFVDSTKNKVGAGAALTRLGKFVSVSQSATLSVIPLVT